MSRRRCVTRQQMDQIDNRIANAIRRAHEGLSGQDIRRSGGWALRRLEKPTYPDAEDDAG